MELLKDQIANVLNLSGAYPTKVGNEIIRGISGGEKKRLSIVEAVNGLAAIQCWDNSTRGMDSATALTILQLFREIATYRRATILVSLYQASQRALDLFDKVTVLYEGQQIFLGTWTQGLSYFETLGFRRSSNMTTGDFFTALTNPLEARHMVEEGKQGQVPVTAEDFARLWQNSANRAQLLMEIDAFDKACPPRNEVIKQLRKARTEERSTSIRPNSTFNVNITRQIQLCLRRGSQRVKNNLALPISTVIGNTVIGTIVGSVFYNLSESSGSINQRTILLFFVVLLNAFMTGFEVLAVWAQRPIVEKHARYALHHPFTEAASAMLVEMPSKILTSIFFNVVVYFMANLRCSASAFFTYWSICFTILMTMSMFYRSVGSMSRTLQGSMVPIGILIIFFIMYTGFVIPERYMHPWFSWIRFLNPVAYAFEAVMINEFHGRTFPCSQYVPSGSSYSDIPIAQRICSAAGAVPGQPYINGTLYLERVFNYSVSHLWRNYGILVAFMIALCAGHIVSSEYILAQKSKGEVLLFLRSKGPPLSLKNDEEAKTDFPHSTNILSEKAITTSKEVKDFDSQDAHKGTFLWNEVCYDVNQKDKPKRLLTSVSGWVKPGTLTALMGATGAGKTTLLDVLSQRSTIGVVTGGIYMNAKKRSPDFQRKTGYVQQQDVHLPTATVRESLQFSALLRQSQSIPKADRLAYVEEVIDLLEMRAYADAIVGVPGEGLNVEQRKRLTIGVELAAKPKLLLFLDEPTSGLDSQTAWTICQLLRKLANHGQAILCTIHQPSSLLLETFDKLLLIEKGGRTVYFGDIGVDCQTLISYFERNGASTFEEESATEWMMEVTQTRTEPNAPKLDWHEKWQNSEEKAILKGQIAELLVAPSETEPPSSFQLGEYAASFPTQLRYLLSRTFIEYWRTPAFLWAKFLFSCGAALAIAFSCWKAPTSLQGIQTQFFAFFTFYTTLSNLMQQIVAQLLERRSLFEAREGPSKTFSWTAFLTSAAITEAVYQTVLAVCTFAIFYYTIGINIGISTVGGESSERAGLMFLLFLAFLLFTSTFSHLLTVGMEHRETIVNIGSLLFYLILIFCGVLVSYHALPGFWKFMYWMSPFTYLIRGMFAVAVARKPVVCSDIELLNLPLPSTASTCGQYFEQYVMQAGGQIVNPESTAVCEYCPLSDTDALLGEFNIRYADRWESLGVMFVFIAFNIAATVLLYWLVRVPKKQKIVET